MRGRTPEAIGEDELAALVAAHRDAVVDLGTGDGRFVLREARARPEALVVGVEPLAEAVAASASRAARRPERGGAPNALFLLTSVERLPEALAGAASLVTVSFPWGSLLRAVGRPDPDVLASVVRLLAPGGRLVAHLNLSAASDPDYAERLDLPPLDAEHVEGRLAPGWRGAGLERVEWRELAPGEAPRHRTTWGQRLVRGSERATLLVEGARPPR